MVAMVTGCFQLGMCSGIRNSMVVWFTIKLSVHSKWHYAFRKAKKL